MQVHIQLIPATNSLLGPDFFIKSDVGTADPDTITLAQLEIGRDITVDDTAQFISLTSIGDCDTEIILAISNIPNCDYNGGNAIIFTYSCTYVGGSAILMSTSMPTSAPTVIPTTITPTTLVPYVLSLAFDDLSSADTLVGNRDSLSDWNTFFNLPVNGTPFTDISIEETTIHLTTLNNDIIIAPDLFRDNTTLYGVYDTGCVIDIKDSAFQGCSFLSAISFPGIITCTGDSCFRGSTINSVDLPNLQFHTQGYMFYECIFLENISLPSFINALYAGMFGFSGVTNVDLPSCTSLNQYMFASCQSLTTTDTINIPNITVLPQACFSDCYNLSTINLPNIISVGDLCFYTASEETYSSLTTIYLPNCISLGVDVLDNAVFGGDPGTGSGTIGNTISLTVDPSLLTCNNGYPDGDIQYLQDNNTITILTNKLELTFNDIGSEGVMMGNLSDVNTWNTFFGLPENGVPFSSVVVDESIVTLTYGNGTIALKDNLYHNVGTSLSSMIDGGFITGIGISSFEGIQSLTAAEFPMATSVSDKGFKGAYFLSSLIMPNVTYVGVESFHSCAALNADFPNLLNADNYAFYLCNALLTPDFTNLVTAGDFCFGGAQGINTAFPNLQTAGNSCFYSAYDLNTDFPALTTIGDSCFLGSGLVSPIFTSLTDAPEYSFASCNSLNSPSFPSLITAGNYAFYQNYYLITLDMPVLETAGIDCFRECLDLTSISLPALITAGNHCFDNSYYDNSGLLVTVNLPKLITAGISSFEGNTLLTTVSLPKVESIGSQSFYNCPALTSINLSSCQDLGGSVDMDNVFVQTIGNTIALSIPPELMTCNLGNPDGDIDFLTGNNTVTTTQVYSGVKLGFNDIANADLLIGGSSSNVSNWNTFFDLPTNGGAFTSVIVIGNDVILKEGSAITLKDNLFDDAGGYGVNLLSFIDYDHCIIATGLANFGVFFHSGCPNLTTAVLPAAINLGSSCFKGTTALRTTNFESVTTISNSFEGSGVITLDFPSLTTLQASSAFRNCVNLTSINLALCTGGGVSLFEGCTSLLSIDMPLANQVPNAMFKNCTSLTTANFNTAVNISANAFENCTSITTLYFPACIQVGTSFANNNVFAGITGRTIHLTIKASVAGDADITALQAANTVTLTTT